MTIGVFDGVHRGHQQIIGRAIERARNSSVPAVVLTFDPNPVEVTSPGTHPTILTTARHKAQILEDLGVDVLTVLPFTAEFSRLSPAEFTHEVLVEHLRACAVVVGENFRFGHRAAGDVGVLARLGGTFGFEAEGVPLLRREDGTKVSSSYVRERIAEGDVVDAGEALGRPHRVDGIVVRGDMRGRELGFPTANLRTEPRVAIPADGVYAGRVVLRGESLPAAVSVGTNPTFDGADRRVEAYVLDFDDDIYGEGIGVEFVQRIRPMERFDRVEDLVDTMKQDVDKARYILR